MAQVSYGTITITDTTDLTTYIRYATKAPLTAASQFQETPTTDTRYIAVLSIPTSDSIPVWNSSSWKWSEFIGTDGLSVKDTRVLYYLKTNSANVPQVDYNTSIVSTDVQNAWTSKNPTYVANGTYWTCLEVVLSDNTTKSWSAPAEDLGLTQTAKDTAEAKSIAQQTIEDAQGALGIARAMQQNFWWWGEDQIVDSSFTLPAGAYTSDIKVDAFKANPIGGYLVTRSDGVYLNNGRYVLMGLTGSALKFYRPGTTKLLSGTETVDAQLTSSGLQITNGSIVLGSTSGTTAGNVTLSNTNFTRSINNTSRNNLRLAIGSKFGVDDSGTLYADGANITNINASNIASGNISANVLQTNVVSAINATANQIDAKNIKTNEITIGESQVTNLSTDLSNAEKVATNYVTQIGNDGIYISPLSQSPSSGTEGNSVKIDGTGMEVFKGGISVAKYSNMITIGVTNGTQSYMVLDFHSLQMKDKEGDTYFYISDLRNNAGVATLSESFVGNGSQKYFNVTLDISSVISVTINGTSTTAYSLSSITRTEIQFNVAPADGAEIIVTYTTTNQNAKSFTLGIRGTGDVGACSIAMGAGTVASEGYSMACGYNAVASGKHSYAEGSSTVASGDYSHAEGGSTIASGRYSHAEGRTTYATGNLSHAEGEVTTAAGLHSHAENDHTKAYGTSSHAQGYDTYAMGNFSTACGNTTRAYGRSTFVIGEYNSYPTPTPAADVRGDHAFIIGNGTSAAPDSNALTVGWNGDITVKNHSSPIGTIKSHIPNAVSCATAKYYKVASITLTAGTWIIFTCANFPATNATGYRDIYTTTDAFTDGTTTMPANYAYITRLTIPAGNYAQVLNASFPAIISSETTFNLVGHQNSGSTMPVTGRMYAVRIN